MTNYHIKNIDTITTPQLIYYTDIIRANTQMAVKIAGDVSRIRSHVKSHKTVEIPKIQAEYGITKFKTATIAESEMMAAAGFKDIFLAYLLVGPNVERFMQLCKKFPATRFIGLTDNFAAAQAINDAAHRHGLRPDIMLDIDPGLHRTGVSVDEAISLYPQLTRLLSLHMIGLHVYDGGGGHALEERLQNTSATYESVIMLKALLQEQGLSVEKITMGGTPSFPCYARFPDVELSPGTCFLQDAGYQEKFPDMPFIPGAAVATRVISSNGIDRVSFDVGNKSIASDPPMAARARLVGETKVETLKHNEEHWVVKVLSGPLPKVGEVHYVIPGHICPTSALYERIAATDENRVIERYFKVASRQRTITL